MYQRCVAFRWRARFFGGGFVDEEAAEPPSEAVAERALTTDIPPPPPPGSCCCCSDERLPSSSVTSRRKMRNDLMTVDAMPCTPGNPACQFGSWSSNPEEKEEEKRPAQTHIR